MTPCPAAPPPPTHHPMGTYTLCIAYTCTDRCRCRCFLFCVFCSWPNKRVAGRRRSPPTAPAKPWPAWGVKNSIIEAAAGLPVSEEAHRATAFPPVAMHHAPPPAQHIAAPLLWTSDGHTWHKLPQTANRKCHYASARCKMQRFELAGS
jgi:hypothetical protein